jgi:hypothetical protein
MKYPDGTEARIGNRVQFSSGEKGTIVFSIDTAEYSNEFPKAQWSYFKKGVMIKTDKGALIHYEDPNVLEVVFVKE